MVGDGRLALAERSHEVTHAHLAVWGRRQDAEHPEPHRIGQGAEPVSQLGRLDRIQRGGQD